MVRDQAGEDCKESDRSCDPVTRRHLMVSAIVGAGVAGAGVTGAMSGPAVAQSKVPTTLSFASSFDRRRDAITLGLAQLKRTVATLTSGKLTLATETARSQSDGADLIAEVAQGKLDVAHVSASAGVKVDPIYGLAGGAPFGLNARLHASWLHDRGGIDLINAALASSGVVLIAAGQSGAQLGGWFRKAIIGPDGFKDQKIAIDGLGAVVLQRLGAKPVSLKPDEIPPSLNGGEIDGAVWGHPYDDESLRLYQAAQILHYPGWWNGAGQMVLVVNKAKFDALGQAGQTALRVAGAEADRFILARFDSQNPAALRRAVASGAQLQPYSEDLLDACFEASQEALSELAGANAKFKQVLDSMLAMRRDGYLWSQLGENTFDTFMMIQQRKQAL